MASPQESITTVSGRRCTRSRARTAATTSLVKEQPTVVTPTEATTSTAVAQVPQIQTSAAVAPPAAPPPAPPPPSPLPPSSTAQAEQPVAAPTTEAAISSAIGTSSAIPTSSATTGPLSDPGPSVPAVAAPVQQQEPKVPASGSSQVTTTSSAHPASPASTSSNPLPIAESQLPGSSTGPLFTAPAASSDPSSVDTNPAQSVQTTTQSQPSTTRQPAAELTTSVASVLPTGDSAGVIAPDQGSNNGPLTLPGSGTTNIGGIIGGVIGGIACLALIVGLLFFCLKKKKSSQVEWSEKRETGPRFMEKMRSFPAGVSVLVDRVQGRKAGPVDNPYQRHTMHASVSSVYSSNSNSRSRSTSEPHGLNAIQRAESTRSTRSKKSQRNLLRKKQGSISSDYRFPAITENKPSQYDANVNYADPFADPDPSKTLFLLNPDPRSGPVTPQVPAATADPASKDPFVSIFDPIDVGAPRIRDPNSNHVRNLSSASAISALSALGSNPPSLLHSMDDPFKHASKGPLALTQAFISKHVPRRSSSTYPILNAATTPPTHNTQFSFFGEPGPSRPGTTLYTPALPTGRTVRQSDPFDLDRPEVLGFQDVLGRKESRGSVTRHATKNRRASSMGNWGVGAGDSPYVPYERDSAKPGALFGKR